jgi:hypothetical protein
LEQLTPLWSTLQVLSYQLQSVISHDVSVTWQTDKHWDCIYSCKLFDMHPTVRNLISFKHLYVEAGHIVHEA